MPVQTAAADIHLRSSQAMGLGSRNSFTITTWINAVWNPGSRRSFVGIYGPATDIPLATPVTAVQIGTSAGNGDLSFWTWGGVVLTTTAAGVMTPRNNTWVFIAYSYDGTTHRGYLNGQEIASSTATQTDGFLNQIFINGFPTSATSEVAAFQIDSYCLYRRVLSQAELQTIFHAAGNRHGIVSDLIAMFEFDELPAGSPVNNVVDLTGNGNNLTPIGVSSMSYAYADSFANSNIRPVQ